jgi:hypothetical protein
MIRKFLSIQPNRENVNLFHDTIPLTIKNKSLEFREECCDEFMRAVLPSWHPYSF